jgi:CRP-like cAMP-binding protein
VAARNRPSPAGSANGNLLLSALTRAVDADGELDEIALVLGERLLHVGDIPRYAYFPLTGVISVVATTERGDSVEVAAIGREGLAAGLAAARALPSSFDLLVQVPGTAVRITHKRLFRLIEGSARFRRAWLDYLHVVMAQMAQSAVCNRYHPASRRLARWLLAVSDRANTDTIPLTHEFAATMVGGDRPRMTTAMRALRSRGFVQQHRGELTILNRPGLSAFSCECYSRVRAVSRRDPRPHRLPDSM